VRAPTATNASSRMASQQWPASGGTGAAGGRQAGLEAWSAQAGNTAGKGPFPGQKSSSIQITLAPFGPGNATTSGDALTS